LQILDRYISRIFLSSFGIVLLFVLGVFMVVVIFANVDKLLQAENLAGYSVAGVLLRFYLVSIPFFFVQTAPYMTLIAATVAVIRLNRGNELVPMVCAGRSPGRITLPIVICAVIAATGMIAIQEFVVPRLADARFRLDQICQGDFTRDYRGIQSPEDKNGNRWHIDSWQSGLRRIEGVTALGFHDPKTGEPMGDVHVKAAAWRRDGPGGAGWYSDSARVIPGHGRPDFGRVHYLPADEPLPLALTPQELDQIMNRRSREAGSMFSISEAARLARENRDVPTLVVNFHALITWPLGTVVLLLVGLPFVFRVGDRNVFVGIGLSALVCAAYFVIEMALRSLGGRATIPPVLAAWLPILLFTSVAIARFDFERSR
jgi:lipopolysaccharide export LptBFGC system permease protein LptF